MLVRDFSFELPDDLIARHPMSERTASRLLQVDGSSGAITHGHFPQLLEQINAGDLLVFNNTRVIPARLYGQKASGGKLEVLVERVLDDKRVLAHVRSSKSPKPGAELILEPNVHATMLARHDTLFEIEFNDSRTVLEILDAVGHMPLPPYIDRPDTDADKERYQTVYNEKPGAVAAPTAGLHFDQALLDAIVAKGAELAFITLHVGAGTFQPVRVEQVLDHKMHAEYIEVPAEVVAKVNATRAGGGRIIAVGTTSVRSLESAAQASVAKGLPLAPFYGDTDIFIYPGYDFQLVDMMVTNFHLPESTLMMLVSAFAGYDHIKEAYRQAIEQRYRFFSYGDAMLLTKQQGPSTRD